MTIVEIAQNTPEWLEFRKDKIKSRISLDKECWIWNGPKFPDGYGNCGSGFPAQRAHRTSYILFNGNIPKNMWVLHKCDKPLCINPDHLYLGDCKQNVKDAIERGLFPRGNNPKKGNKGEKNGRCKLKNYQISKIINEYIPYRNGFHKLSKKYNVSKRQIMRIIQGKSRKCV